MKRIHALLAIVLCAALIIIGLTPVSAETERVVSDHVPSNSITKDKLVPVSYLANTSMSIPAGVLTEEKTASCNTVGSDGMLMHIEAVFVLANAESTENEWANLSGKFEEVALDYIAKNGTGNLKNLPNDLANAVYIDRKSEQPNADESLWTNTSALILKSIEITSPYFIDLAVNSVGSSVTQLQTLLIRLGYLDGAADGHFGPKTKQAVESLQTYVRSLEQSEIDAAQPQATAPSQTPSADIEPYATPELARPEPATTVDGVMSADLQAYVFSDAFPYANGSLKQGDSSDAVMRLQRRLIQLGYLTGAADGSYGGNTRRGVYLYQHYNGFEKTGVADVETQQSIFSSTARQPEYPLMTLGSTGEDVRELQKRLLYLGFATGAADGDFGNSTKEGIENLQTYLREKEKEALAQIAPYENQSTATSEPNATPTPPPAIDETKLTVEVNGIADPLLLEAFNAPSFPAIPGAMKSGDSGLEVKRLQRRLLAMEYLYSSPDGSFGGGTTEAVKSFQKRNNLEQTGIADEATIGVMFSDKALKAIKPYVLKVSIADQRVYAYGLDKNDENTVLVRTMKCSTGLSATPTPKGTYQSTTGPGARWHYFKKFTCWAQYAYYIKGDYMFHSVLYSGKNTGLIKGSVNNLGRKASHGCVRLSVEDAKWIYTNCPPRTKIIVY